MDPEESPDDPEEYYDHQLIGLDVVLLDGTLVGELTEVVHLPYQDLLTVRKADGTDALVPFVSRIVPTIDLENQRAVIDPPVGLIDLGQAEVAAGEAAGGEAAGDDVAGDESAAGADAGDAEESR